MAPTEQAVFNFDTPKSDGPVKKPGSDLERNWQNMIDARIRALLPEGAFAENPSLRKKTEKALRSLTTPELEQMIALQSTQPRIALLLAEECVAGSPKAPTFRRLAQRFQQKLDEANAPAGEDEAPYWNK